MLPLKVLKPITSYLDSVIGLTLKVTLIMHQIQSRTLTTSQIAQSTLVPLAKVYALKKQLIAGHHYREIRSTSNTKQIEWLPAGATAIEALYWLPAGKKAVWSPARLEAFQQTGEASLYLEVAT